MLKYGLKNCCSSNILTIGHFILGTIYIEFTFNIFRHFILTRSDTCYFKH